MPTKDKITEEIYLCCKRMLYVLLADTNRLGAGYVIQMVYELSIVVVSYENGSEIARDKFVRGIFDEFVQLVDTRNTINHNCYDSKRICKAVNTLIESEAVRKLYIKIFGDAPGYKIFETECLVYLEYMKRLWGVK